MTRFFLLLEGFYGPYFYAVGSLVELADSNYVLRVVCNFQRNYCKFCFHLHFLEQVTEPYWVILKSFEVVMLIFVAMWINCSDPRCILIEAESSSFSEKIIDHCLSLVAFMRHATCYLGSILCILYHVEILFPSAHVLNFFTDVLHFILIIVFCSQFNWILSMQAIWGLVKWLKIKLIWMDHCWFTPHAIFCCFWNVQKPFRFILWVYIHIISIWV